MDKISKVRQEIERRMLEDYNSDNEEMKYADEVAQGVCASLLFFIDTLEAEASYDTQKYTPSPSVGIEDVARVQFASHAKVFDKKRKAVFDWEQFKEVAGIFYGFGKKDSPETKEKEQPDKSLEEAASGYADKHGFRVPYDGSNNFYDDVDMKASKEGFIAGAKWQAEQDDRDVVFWKGMQHAIAEMKEDAVEGEVVKDISNKLAVTAKINLDGFKFGEKVKVIIIKEDGKSDKSD